MSAIRTAERTLGTVRPVSIETNPVEARLAELTAEIAELRAVVVGTHQPHDDALLTLRRAAELLSVSYSSITKWTARGEFCPLAFKLPNGEYRVRYRDLMRWALGMRGDGG